ncbi:transglutaminase family protein [Methylophilus sp. 14]|uniref:transglutaminase family protein n=1 Tax=Methylophilus sp. 14 TaxID=2781019 RepID=UPI00188DE9C9|nr:transglutaminase family protein [Methylophilus sp. 14]MBF4988777.1 transglutaminase family protein [Methylophilus sp. 14]
MLLNIEHQTHYAFSEMVQYTIQQLRLTPRTGDGQQVNHWQIKVNGQLTAFEDAFGNLAHTLVIDQLHDELTITACGEVETGVETAVPEQALPLDIYLRDTPLTQADAAMTTFAQQFAGAPLLDMMQALREQMQYIQGATQVDTPAATAFRLGKGVCQDHAHAFIGCCRSLGLPARYVSGYLFTEDGHLMQTHAWVDVWQADHWLGLDVSNGILTNETHIRLATGLDYRSASPVTGSRMGGGSEGMASMVNVNQHGRLTDKQRAQYQQQLRQQVQAAQQ